MCAGLVWMSAGVLAQDDAASEPQEETAAPAGKSIAPIDDTPVSAMPVEDPTLLPPTEAPAPPEVEAPSEEKPTQEEPPATEDEGPDVQVAYNDQFQLAINNWFYFTLDGLAQARYTLNVRQTPPFDFTTFEQEKNVTNGFEVARARFTMGIGLTDFVSIVMRIGVVAGGDFSFQRAFIDLKWKYFRLRAGLFMHDLIAEMLVNPADLLLVDYTILGNVYSPGSAAGVMFSYIRTRFSINASFSNGLRTGFSEIRAPQNADYAFTVRAQYAWGERGLSGFNNLQSLRGVPFGVRLGGAAHYQDGGKTQGTRPVRIAIGTLDVSFHGNGWSAFFAGAVGQDGSDETPDSILAGGLTAMGAYFVLKNLEVFAQYSAVYKPRIQGNPSVSDPLVGDLNNFHSVGGGLSYYILPNHQNLKLTGDFQYFIGTEGGSLVPSSPLNSIQRTEEGNQWALRVQLTAAF